ncbi:transcriptional regulator GcvA [Thioalkalivibrio sp. HK1]|uniref:transcriptional regulator GcvA n=1 Tax=Thioalkalivibrio sp. HK1 TaxID=1469245 RepID=UPI00046EE9C0|nr:transcriptional regulator GcvA [Thioalkalivibrio sp. HK1]
MPRRLPPLNALRVFEAAARHLSFTRAADELFVTQAAISHQIRSLEDYIGQKLFRRNRRALLLTDAGQSLQPAVSKALDIIHTAIKDIAREDRAKPLTVSALPSFAASWLVPRLGRFRERYPDIDLRIDPLPDIIDFRQSDVDVAIRYGRGQYPGLRTDRLLEEDKFPVCSPQLLQNIGHKLTEPADLAHYNLLHDDGHLDWRTWLLAAGVDNIDPTRGTVFTDSSMLIRAAVEAQGVALARSVIAEGELAAGRLIRPFDLNLSTEHAYYLVCPQETAGRPNIVAFREWIIDEAMGGGHRKGGDETGGRESSGSAGVRAGRKPNRPDSSAID